MNSEQITPECYRVERLDLDGIWWMNISPFIEPYPSKDEAKAAINEDKKWRKEMCYPKLEYRIIKRTEEVVE